jgi:hypothetical protein
MKNIEDIIRNNKDFFEDAEPSKVTLKDLTESLKKDFRSIQLKEVLCLTF